MSPAVPSQGNPSQPTLSTASSPPLRCPKKTYLYKPPSRKRRNHELAKKKGEPTDEPGPCVIWGPEKPQVETASQKKPSPSPESPRPQPSLIHPESDKKPKNSIPRNPSVSPFSLSDLRRVRFTNSKPQVNNALNPS